jgi:hypothetical protein
MGRRSAGALGRGSPFWGRPHEPLGGGTGAESEAELTLEQRQEIVAAIQFSEAGVAEIEGGRHAVFVPRQELIALSLAYTTGAERPTLILALALVLLAVSLYPILIAIDRILNGGFVSKGILMMCGFLPVSWWLFRLGSKRRFVVVARTRSTTRKLLVDAHFPPDALLQALSDAAGRFGFSLEVLESAAERLRP